MIWQRNLYSRSPKTLKNRSGMCIARPLSDLSGSRQAANGARLQVCSRPCWFALLRVSQWFR